VSARNRIESSSQSATIDGTESESNSTTSSNDDAAAAKSLKVENGKLSQQLADLQVHREPISVKFLCCFTSITQQIVCSIGLGKGSYFKAYTLQ
jgi:hypothetical protein